MSGRLAGRWTARCGCSSAQTLLSSTTRTAFRSLASTPARPHSTSATTERREEEHVRASASLSSSSTGKRFAIVRPDLVDDWIPEMNDLDVQSVLCSSPVRAWWRCTRCQTSYQATVKERVAREAACCPHCHGQGLSAVGATEASVLDETPTSTTGAPLSDTHPDVAALWDTEANGSLRPVHVHADSTVSVWWRRTIAPSSSSSPPSSSPSSSSHPPSSGVVRFRRPVFAMVRDPVSPHEKRRAQAVLEEHLLQQIHDAAHVEAAEPSTLLPAASSRLFAAQSPMRHVPLRTVPPPASAVVTPLTQGPALDLWKQRVLADVPKAPSQPEEVQASAQAEEEEAAAAAVASTASEPSTGRALFYHSDSLFDHNVWHQGTRLRGALLDAYVHFVQSRRRTAGLAEDVTRAPSILAAAEKGDGAAWLDVFTLTEAQARAQTRLDDVVALQLGRHRDGRARRALNSPPTVHTHIQTTALRERDTTATRPAPSTAASEAVLRNYPQLPLGKAREARGTVAAPSTLAAPHPRRRELLSATPHAGVPRTSPGLTEAALHEAFQEAKASPTPSSSPLLDVALAAENAVSDQRARQYGRLTSPVAAWSPEALLEESLAAARRTGSYRAELDQDMYAALTDSGYPTPVLSPRKVKRVRLQPPPELQRAGGGVWPDPHHLRGDSAKPQNVLAMLRDATGKSSSSTEAASPPASAPALSGPKTPRKVARPTRKTTST